VKFPVFFYRHEGTDIESEKLLEKNTEKDAKGEIVVVRRRKKVPNIQSKLPPGKNYLFSIKDPFKGQILLLGWEMHSDEDGFYYWHVKSGTIQVKNCSFAKKKLQLF